MLYGVTAVYTKVKAQQTLTVQIESTEGKAPEQAEALVVAVIALNRQHLIDVSRATYRDGDYGAQVEVKSLTLESGSRPADDQRLLTVLAEVELKASRALREDEGRPIERILSPGRPETSNRPIDIEIEVDA